MRFTPHGKFFLIFATIAAISLYYQHGSWTLRILGGLALYFAVATVVMALFSIGKRDDEEEDSKANTTCEGC